jgi:hypothetical protein
MERRRMLSRFATLPLLASLSAAGSTVDREHPLQIMMKSAWGSDDPTKAAFPFLHGHALAEAGHMVQIFLLGEAVSLMRPSVAKAVVPVGWPPRPGTLECEIRQSNHFRFLG